MSSRLLARTAAALTGALATALVAGPIAGPPAHAGSGTTTYDCTFPVVGSVPVPVQGTIPDLPPVAPGAPIPAGALSPDFVFSLTDGLAGALGLASGLSGSASGLGLGGGTVPLGALSLGSPSGLSLPASAASGAFTAPATPGVHDLTMPSRFDLVGTLNGSPLAVPCLAAGAPAVLGALTVLGDEPGASESTTEASLAKTRIAKGRRAKVTVGVTLSPVPLPGTGDVVIKKGKKTIGRGTLESGAVTIRTDRFKRPGSYTLKAKYVGEPPLVTGSTDTVVLKVKRRR